MNEFDIAALNKAVQKSSGAGGEEDRVNLLEKEEII